MAVTYFCFEMVAKLNFAKHENHFFSAFVIKCVVLRKDLLSFVIIIFSVCYKFSLNDQSMVLKKKVE